MISFDFIWFHTSFHGTTCFFFLLKAKDNIEALSLALFVECFIGENLGSAVSGGFVMSSGQVPKWKMSMLGKLWGKMIGSTAYFYVLNVFYMFYFLELLEVVWTQRCYFWNFVVMHGCHFGIQTCLFLQPVFELSRPLWPIALTTKDLTVRVVNYPLHIFRFIVYNACSDHIWHDISCNTLTFCNYKRKKHSTLRQFYQKCLTPHPNSLNLQLLKSFASNPQKAVRRVVLSLLRSWSENLKALRALSPWLGLKWGIVRSAERSGKHEKDRCFKQNVEMSRVFCSGCEISRIFLRCKSGSTSTMATIINCKWRECINPIARIFVKISGTSQQNRNVLRFYCKSENKLVVYHYPYQGNPKLEYSRVALSTSAEVQKLKVLWCQVCCHRSKIYRCLTSQVMLAEM